MYFFHLNNRTFSPVCGHNHPFSWFIDWPEDGESNEQCFPLVGEGEVLHTFLLWGGLDLSWFVTKGCVVNNLLNLLIIGGMIFLKKTEFKDSVNTSFEHRS